MGDIFHVKGTDKYINWNVEFIRSNSALTLLFWSIYFPVPTTWEIYDFTGIPRGCVVWEYGDGEIQLKARTFLQRIDKHVEEITWINVDTGQYHPSNVPYGVCTTFQTHVEPRLFRSMIEQQSHQHTTRSSIRQCATELFWFPCWCPNIVLIIRTLPLQRLRNIPIYLITNRLPLVINRSSSIFRRVKYLNTKQQHVRMPLSLFSVIIQTSVWLPITLLSFAVWYYMARMVKVSKLWHPVLL